MDLLPQICFGTIQTYCSQPLTFELQFSEMLNSVSICLFHWQKLMSGSFWWNNGLKNCILVTIDFWTLSVIFFSEMLNTTCINNENNVTFNAKYGYSVGKNNETVNYPTLYKFANLCETISYIMMEEHSQCLHQNNLWCLTPYIIEYLIVWLSDTLWSIPWVVFVLTWSGVCKPSALH